MNLDWLKTGLSPLKDLLSYLTQAAKTNDILRKQVIRELRDNLNIFYNAHLNNIAPDTMIEMLSNTAIRKCQEANFKFRKLKAGAISMDEIRDERNRKYVGWTAEKLIDKIDEKIEELRNIRKMNGGSVVNAKNNINLMLSNLYFRMKLLADFIRGPFQDK